MKRNYKKIIPVRSRRKFSINNFRKIFAEGDILQIGQRRFLFCSWNNLLRINSDNSGEFIVLPPEANAKNNNGLISKKWILENLDFVCDPESPRNISIFSYYDSFLAEYKRINDKIPAKFTYKFLEFKDDLKNGDIIECHKAFRPYDRKIKFIVATDTEGCPRLPYLEGFYSGMFAPIGYSDKMRSNKGREYAISSSWLIKNWEAAFVGNCDIRHTYVNLQNRKEILNFTDKQLENFIKIKRKRFKFKWKK